MWKLLLMATEFVWTDELVKEFAQFHIDDFVNNTKWPEDSDTLLKKFKQSHTPTEKSHIPKDFELKEREIKPTIFDDKPLPKDIYPNDNAWYY